MLRPFGRASRGEACLAPTKKCQTFHAPISIYKGVKVGEYIPDLIVFHKIVVDVKVIDRITDHEVGQILNYLKITGLKLGIILNFRRAKLEWKRIIS